MNTRKKLLFRKFYSYWVTLAAVALTASLGCGGGGGNGSAGQPTLSVNTHEIVFIAGNPNGQVPPTQYVTGSVTNATGQIYVSISTPGKLLQGATFLPTSTTSGRIELVPTYSSLLGIGEFKEAMTVSASTDASGVNQIAGSPQTINITYKVRGISTTPSDVILESAEGQAPPPYNLPYRFSSGSNNWTASIEGTDSSWLTLGAYSGTGTEGNLQLFAAPKSIGHYQATIVFTSQGLTVNVPVLYRVGLPFSVDPNIVNLWTSTGATLPDGVTVNVTNNSPGSSPYLISIDYIDGNGVTGWLDATGNTAPGQLLLKPNTTNLHYYNAPYHAMVRLRQTPNGSSTDVLVVYHVDPGPISTLK